MKDILIELKGQLIVSTQALKGEALYNEKFSLMPFMAKAAKLGAKAIRANGIRDIKAIKKVIDLPIIGLIKKQYKPYSQYITVGMSEIDKLVKAKVDIIALDCTLRERYDGLTINQFIKKIKKKYPNVLLMADISNLKEAINAQESGVDIIGSTLSGYTEYTKKTENPDYKLIKQLVENIKIPIIAEGRINTPKQAKKMLDLGAWAVVVGSAITRPFEITKRFVKEIKNN